MRLVDALSDEKSHDADDILDALLEWTDTQEISLYEAQEEAFFEICDGKHVILNTPTGSGKSLVAVAAHFYAYAKGMRSYYTSPIKALVNEKFFALCETFGAERVGMLTGDASVNPNAPIICCTAEVLANMSLRQGDEANVGYVIMDEFHYYSDPERGWAWQVPLLTLKNTTFLLMSATLGDLESITDGLEAKTGRNVALVQSFERPVPLEYIWVESPIHETLPRLSELGRTPTYVVCFTQRECAELAQALTSLTLTTREERMELRDAIGHFRFNTPYGKDVQRFLSAGIGIHHAGLLPRYRLLVEKLAQQGLLKVIVGTDTLGVGINVPIRSVLFTRLYKYDGQGTGLLDIRSFRQIAGRAGRKGFDNVGYVYCQAPEHEIENKRLEAKAKKGRKLHRQKPPRDFVNYTEKTFQKMIASPAEELVPQFEVNHGILLQLLQRDTEDSPRGDGYRTLVQLVLDAQPHPYEQRKQLRQARLLFQSLLHAGIVELEPRESDKGQIAVINQDLQDNFSLFQALSLYLVEVLAHLNQNEETYALDILSIVEAILENPAVILRAQESKAKGERIAELKAEGMDYEDRMQKLEEVTWPKPLEEFLYETYNAFAATNPWLGRENVRPKSIARDLVERYMSFNEYIKEYGLSRSEGVLLRYLSQAYKTAAQNVPEGFQNDELLDVLAHLRATLTAADASLVAEWEDMRQGTDSTEDPDAPPRPRPLWADEKGLRARIRAEMLALVKAIHTGDFEDAAALTRAQIEHEWLPEDIESAIAPFVEEYGEPPIFDHAARSAQLTNFEKISPQHWKVTQTLLDPNDDRFWFIQAEIDLSEDLGPDEPILTVTHIGE